MSAHYFADRPDAASHERTVELSVGERRLSLVTDSGVFSPRQIDPGTRVLLAAAPVPTPDPAGGDLLDLGCGYGPVALWLAELAPRRTVWAVDVNERARALAERNAAAAGLANVRVAAPDDVAPEVSFGGIYANPPIRIGKVELHALLLRWLDRLRPEGMAYLVVQRHLGSDSLARWLGERGFATERRASRHGFRVLEVPARPAPESPGG